MREKLFERIMWGASITCAVSIIVLYICSKINYSDGLAIAILSIFSGFAVIMLGLIFWDIAACRKIIRVTEEYITSEEYKKCLDVLYEMRRKSTSRQISYMLTYNIGLTQLLLDNVEEGISELSSLNLDSEYKANMPIILNTVHILSLLGRIRDDKELSYRMARFYDKRRDDLLAGFGKKPELRERAERICESIEYIGRGEMEMAAPIIKEGRMGGIPIISNYLDSFIANDD